MPAKRVPKVEVGAIFLAMSISLACEDARLQEQGESSLQIHAADSLGRALNPITAEIAAMNVEAAEKFNLLARVEVVPNYMIEFYEPSPGRIMLSGAGAPARPLEAPIFDRGRSPEEIWKLIAGDAEKPDELKQAFARAKNRIPRKDPGQEPPPGFGGGNSTSKAPQAAMLSRYRAGSAPWHRPQSAEIASGETIPVSMLHAKGRLEGGVQRQAGWCDSGFFEHPASQCWGDFQVCFDNWWDGAYAYHHDCREVFSSVCPATGSVTFRIRTNDDGIQQGVWTVNQNTLRQYYDFDDDCDWVPFNDCPYVRADVEDAGGDRFHFRFRVIAE